MSDIPKDVVKVLGEGYIPNVVAEFAQDTETPETRPYLISFSKYNEKLCEISLLTSNKARRIIENLKTIGTKIYSKADFQKYNIDRLPVYNNGDYKKLFNGLSADIELKEIHLQQDARIFYFDIEPEGVLYIVAITENHLETRKVRR